MEIAPVSKGETSRGQCRNAVPWPMPPQAVRFLEAQRVNRAACGGNNKTEALLDADLIFVATRRQSHIVYGLPSFV